MLQEELREMSFWWHKLGCCGHSFAGAGWQLPLLPWWWRWRLWQYFWQHSEPHFRCNVYSGSNGGAGGLPRMHALSPAHVCACVRAFVRVCMCVFARACACVVYVLCVLCVCLCARVCCVCRVDAHSTNVSTNHPPLWSKTSDMAWRK